MSMNALQKSALKLAKLSCTVAEVLAASSSLRPFDLALWS